MIDIKQINTLDSTELQTAQQLLDHEEMHSIACLNWPENFPYKPEVHFQAAHNGKELFLRYTVNEQSAAALKTTDNTLVCQDSCVEFFISFDDLGYYNFEFSCIGTIMLGYHTDRQHAEYADKNILAAIKRFPSLGQTPFTETKMNAPWQLLVVIPVSSFFKHGIATFTGLKAHANFYKCGDHLSTPHYVTFEIGRASCRERV